MVWIAFFVWFILWLLFYVKSEFLWGKLKHFYGLLKPEVLPGTEHIQEYFEMKEKQPLCSCPAAFPVDQRYSDGKTCVGVKGSFLYSLPLSCCMPLNKCSSQLPPFFPKNTPTWDAKSWQNPPIEKKEQVIVVEQPTLRDLTGVGPRSYWCYEGQSKDGEPKCKRHLEDPLRPARNQCGSPMVSQVPNPVFTSEQQCKEQSNPCYGLAFNKCVVKTGCGWCEELSGKGSCKKGTPEGPLDVTLTCAPSTSLATGSWSPGSPDGYLLQEPARHDEAWEYNPEVLPTWKPKEMPIDDHSRTWVEWRKQMVPPPLLKRV